MNEDVILDIIINALGNIGGPGIVNLFHSRIATSIALIILLSIGIIKVMLRYEDERIREN